MIPTIGDRAGATRRRGGDVFVRDLHRAPESYLQRLESQTGLGEPEWARLTTETAFICEGVPFVRILAIRPAITEEPPPVP